MEKLYTAKQLAELLQIHQETVYRLGREGKLKRVQVGRSVRFSLGRSTRNESTRNSQRN